MSRAVNAGLVLLGLLSVVDAAGLLLTDGEHPPVEIAAIGTALGVISLVLIVFAWRGSRPALGTLVVLRLLSAATAVPAFIENDVPPVALGFAAAAVALTLIGCALVAPGLRRRTVTPA